MPRLTEEQRNQAVGMLINTSVSNVARFFNTSRKTIRQLNNRFITTGSVKDRPRSGQPRKTTPAVDRRNKKSAGKVSHCLLHSTYSPCAS